MPGGRAGGSLRSDRSWEGHLEWIGEGPRHLPGAFPYLGKLSRLRQLPPSIKVTLIGAKASPVVFRPSASRAASAASAYCVV